MPKPNQITDEKGQLQYIPFPTCNETGQPLELAFGVEKAPTQPEINCTIPFISDDFFHLLEFYVHNDSPLTCRIPARPLTGEHGIAPVSASSEASNEADYIPLTFAISGALQLSHLHISNHLNVVLHATAPPSRSLPAGGRGAVIDSAIAYSISPGSRTTRIVIGDALPLHLSVRWYPSPRLPRGWPGGGGGHVHLSTLGYCLLSVLATAAACLAYFRGVELPRKLRRYGGERLGAGEGEGGGGGGGGYGGGKVGGGNWTGYGASGGRRGSGSGSARGLGGYGFPVGGHRAGGGGGANGKIE
ncbi:MAG: hypothetical protein M1826_006043 [Phylliscum demangeonii]|nr:MAG: hypothetical protein M1826_006043 [Phylliscum demangeonii]